MEIVKYMKSTVLFVLFSINNVCAQTNFEKYWQLTDSASYFLKVKNYNGSIEKFEKAFSLKKVKVNSGDRYNAACIWAIKNESEKALKQLKIISFEDNFNDYSQLVGDSDFVSLHKLAEWDAIVERVKSNKVAKELKYSKELISKLDTVFNDDQKYRTLQISAINKYGAKSNEALEIGAKMTVADSINVNKIISFIDNYGWLGEDVIGNKGALTLFLVIQHANLKVQKKYFPIIKKAALEKKIKPDRFALLQDRIAQREGRKQKYGTQVAFHDKQLVIDPTKNPKRLNHRRKKIGLDPIEHYMKTLQLMYSK